MLRIHTCGELRREHIGQKTILTGWVDSIRNHGSLVFIDLRDRYGITQITFDTKPDTDQTLLLVNEIGHEWVLKMTGLVKARPKNMVNKKISTGEIELQATEIEVLNRSKVLPFELSDKKVGSVNEA
jgi:aspartyl-tRNA synthetase